MNIPTLKFGTIHSADKVKNIGAYSTDGIHGKGAFCTEDQNYPYNYIASPEKDSFHVTFTPPGATVQNPTSSSVSITPGDAKVFHGFSKQYSFPGAEEISDQKFIEEAKAIQQKYEDTCLTTLTVYEAPKTKK